MAGKFELKKSPSGKFMFNLKAANNQVILSSELYNEKASAQNGIKSVKKNAGADANYERKTSKKGEPFFVLKAPNGQIIGKSEMYASAKGMENGIASVKANAPGASVVEVPT
jgi:uncharacterized protein YegP (UPF0339 family)